MHVQPFHLMIRNIFSKKKLVIKAEIFFIFLPKKNFYLSAVKHKSNS